MSVEQFDYIVVGGGSGGSTVAGRLAEAGAQVLVLEAGGTDRRPDVLIPAGLVVAYSTCNWKYIPEPDPTRGGSIEAWPAGKILGGGGAINAGVFVRGNPADFDGWAEAGATGWGFDAVLPYFRRMETWSGPSSEFRGTAGPISVGYQTVQHGSTEPFIAAAMSCGHGFTEDYNGERQVGVGYGQVNQRRGVRSHASREYLRRLHIGTPVTVRHRAFVTRLLFDGNRAVGAEYRRWGRTYQCHARAEVVLAAGALITPKLLMLSGIGPSAHLSDASVERRVDLPGVGRNLQEHPAVFQRWVSKCPTLNTIGVGSVVRGIGEYAASREGLLTTSPYQAQVMHKTRPDLNAPDIQVGFSCFATERIVGNRGKVRVQPTRWAGLQTTTVFLHPRYRGRISIRSADPQAPPVIRHDLLGTEEDTRDLLAGLAEARRIMAHGEMKDVVGPMCGAEKDCRTDADWLEFVRVNATNGAHPVGTCALGVDENAVVDTELRVRDVEGLRISDASVIPTAISGNTNAATMMIGERAAQAILDHA
ncbi:GMC family oxidoreductase [Mycolicibacterium austroafricanum]|uniref:GMC family oxidoreductase n=1 Tax=Mycolicibacterium austroafricanum TaxID=39687 RepID=UPI001CA326E2|nr:GMC family oxidoreductase N-terminal domain-containing protein [Mycolicibacterium austroafricanum]QZT58573.1 GMC family oxidoreductase N-terminal domain-containing protein [Mycolicibacterium austroafricanum]